MEKARQLAAKPHCIDFRVLNKQLIGVEMRKIGHFINKLFQHRFSVLEWSKYKMYSFYALFKDTFGKQVRMLYTDTDSFFLHFFVDDLVKEICSSSRVRNAFDFSEISRHHLSHIGTTDDKYAGQIGYFKDECIGDPIIEFDALRPRMYSFTVCKASEYILNLNALPALIKTKAVAKGVSRANIRGLTHDDYVAMFRQPDQHKVVNRHIRSKLHQVCVLFCFLNNKL